MRTPSRARAQEYCPSSHVHIPVGPVPISRGNSYGLNWHAECRSCLILEIRRKNARVFRLDNGRDDRLLLLFRRKVEHRVQADLKTIFVLLSFIVFATTATAGDLGSNRARAAKPQVSVIIAVACRNQPSAR